jgi:SH3-like domain-containing protein
MEGDEGWVLKSMLSGKRAALVKDGVQTMLKKPDERARPIVRLEPGVVAGLKRCKDSWCELSVAGYTGWLKRAGVWGVYPDENFGSR